MDIRRYQDLVEADGHRLLAVARDTDLAAAVPPCPGWTVGDAVAHTAEVYEHKIACIAAAGARPAPWPPTWPEDRDPRVWFADALARLLATLRTVDPQVPSWTWWPGDQSAGFWSRRMAHETAVHRVDVESAAGAVTAVDAELAADGIDEVLAMMLAGDWSDEPQPGSTGTVRIWAVGDGPGWRVTMSPTDVRVEAEGPVPSGAVPSGAVPSGHDSADVTVSGTPSDVDLWLWGRLPAAALDIAGDAEVAARFRARMVIATR